MQSCSGIRHPSPACHGRSRPLQPTWHGPQSVVWPVAGGPSSDAPSSRHFQQRRQSHQEASTSGRHALPSRRDSGRCSASRASAPQRAVAQAYTSFRRKIRNRTSDKPTGVGSDDGSNEINPVYGSSKYPWLTSFLKYGVLTGGTAVAAWYGHPYLLDELAELLHLDYKESVTAFQTSFFSCLSLLFAIFSGNSMAFLYERQKELVRVFYLEVAALEDVLEESVYALGTDARTILVQIRKYVDQEIRAPNNQLPPLEDGLALMAIRTEARRFKEGGAEMDQVLAASAKLAEAQTQRQAIACRLLPGAHWALLYVIATTFVLSFIMFESGGSFSNEGRHTLWTLLCALMVFVLTVLNDLADPSEGVYSATALMEERLGYTHRMLARHYQMPIVPEAGTKGRNANTNAYLNRGSPGGDGIPQPPSADGIMPGNGGGGVAVATRKKNQPEDAPQSLVAEAQSAAGDVLERVKESIDGHGQGSNGADVPTNGAANGAANGVANEEQRSKTTSGM